MYNTVLHSSADGGLVGYCNHNDCTVHDHDADGTVVFIASSSETMVVIVNMTMTQKKTTG